MSDTPESGKVCTNAKTRTVLNQALGGFGKIPSELSEISPNTSCKQYYVGPCRGAWYCITHEYPSYDGMYKEVCTETETVDPSATEDYIIPLTYSTISDIGDFGTVPGAVWKYRVGIVCYGVKAGDGYIKQFCMGLPTGLGVNIIGKDDAEKSRNSYNVSVTWMLKTGKSLDPNATPITTVKKDLGEFNTIPVRQVVG